MPRPKPSPFAGTAELNATIGRVAPRSQAAILDALADGHDRRDVTYALVRLAVTGRVEETGGGYTLGMTGEGS